MGIIYKGFERPDITTLYDTMSKYYSGQNKNKVESFQKYYDSLPDVITSDAARVDRATKGYFSVHDVETNKNYALSKQDVISGYIDCIFDDLHKIPMQRLYQASNLPEYKVGYAMNAANLSSADINKMMKSYVFSDEFMSKVTLNPKEKAVIEKLQEILAYENKDESKFQYLSSAEFLSTCSVNWKEEDGSITILYLGSALKEIMHTTSDGKAILELLIYGTSRLVPDAHTDDGSPFSGYAGLQTLERKEHTDGYTTNIEQLTNNQTTSFADTDSSKTSLSLEALLSSENAADILAYVQKYSTKLLDYDLTPNKYFCGNDAYVFLNGVRVGEITYIDWELTEKKQPIYGYASYTFDDIAVGTRIVTGKISVNFTKTKYLDGLQKYSKDILNKTNLNMPSTINSVQDIFGAMDGLDETDALASKKAYIKTVFENREDEELTKVINELEQLMFNTGSGSAIVDKSQQPYFNNPNANGNHEGFTIMIPWGDELFKIAGLESNGNETLTIINDVYITSEASEVKIGAENVQQVFTYIARDMNNTILTNEEKQDIYKLKS